MLPFCSGSRSIALGCGIALACALGGCFRIGYDPAARHDAPLPSAGRSGADADASVMQGGAGAGGKPDAAGAGANGGASGAAAGGGGAGAGGSGTGGDAGADAGADSGTSSTTDAGTDSGNTQTPQEQCLGLAFSGPAACKQCRCSQCTDAVLHCSGIGSGSDANCEALVACGRANACTGESCSCGTSPQCASPNGPCASELTDAATAAGLTPAECNTEPTCAGYQALAVGDCIVSQCSDECL